MKKVLSLATIAIAFLPTLVSAQGSTPTGIGGIFKLLNQANDLINRLIPFVIALTVLVFLWGVFQFVIAGADGDKREEARGYMIWGIIALFVMVSVWGLVNILVKTFDLESTNVPQPPKLPLPSQLNY